MPSTLQQVVTGQKGISTAEQPTSLMITAAVDFLVDGLLVGLAFVLGAQTGLLLTLALSIEALFLSLAVALALRQAKSSSNRLIAIAAGFALLLAIGAVLGASFFGGLSGPTLAIVLAFGAAALLYLVTEELLVEAHEHHASETPMTAAMFFVGFLLVLLMAMQFHS